MASRKGRKRKSGEDIETDLGESSPSAVAKVNKGSNRTKVAKKGCKLSIKIDGNAKRVNGERKVKAVGAEFIEIESQGNESFIVEQDLVRSNLTDSDNQNFELQNLQDPRRESMSSSQDTVFETSFREGEDVIKIGVDAQDEHDEVQFQKIDRVQHHSPRQASQGDATTPLCDDERRERIKQIDREMRGKLQEIHRLMSMNGLTESAEMANAILAEGQKDQKQDAIPSMDNIGGQGGPSTSRRGLMSPEDKAELLIREAEKSKGRIYATTEAEEPQMSAQVNLEDAEEVLNYSNWDLENIVTPIDVIKFAELLKRSGYDKGKSEFLVQGFTRGFSMQYQGPRNRAHTAQNLPCLLEAKLSYGIK